METDLACRLFSRIGLALLLLGASGNCFGQSVGNGSTAKPEFKAQGKSVFESRCAVCHGLDARGGEHAPDIARSSTVRNLSDDALLDLIHKGIPQRGMPGFNDLGKEDGQALIAHVRLLQSQSEGGPSMGRGRGDRTHGQVLFSGKAGCSVCHAMGGHGQFTAVDLAGYGQDHRGGEIIAAILNPAGRREGVATAVAVDGRNFSGTIRNEDNASLQLQDADGRFYLLMKSSLTSIDRRPGTAVHIDYGHKLSSTEIDDLVSYILHPGKSPEQDDDDDNN